MGKFGAGNLAIKIIAVVAIIIVMVAVSIFTIMDGIIALIEQFFQDLVGVIGAKVTHFLKQVFHVKFDGQTKTYIIGKESVGQLTEMLEANAIDTEACGLTEIRLKKMLLSESVSTSFEQTLCAITVAPYYEEDETARIQNEAAENTDSDDTSDDDNAEEDETGDKADEGQIGKHKFDKKPETRAEEIEEMENQIVQNVKQKDKYKDIEELEDFLDDPVHKKSSKDLWPGIDVDYTLYFDSESFFYFQDEEDVFGNGADEWYLAAMGAIEIEKATGGEMVYADAATFEQMGDDFKASINDFFIGNQDFNEEEMLKIYTDGDSPNTIKVWNLEISQTEYTYEFQNDNINGGNTVIYEGIDAGEEYNIEPQEIDLETRVNISKFALSTELIVDLLNVSASGQFIETFIDYALGHIKAKILVHQLKDESITYCKEEYQIKDDFILEVYDFIDYGDTEFTDIGDDNFKAYADIVYERKYNGKNFEGTVADLLTNTIDRDGEDKGEVTVSAEEIGKIIKEKTNVDINELIETVFGENEDEEDQGVIKQKVTELIKETIVSALENETVQKALSAFFNVTSSALSGLSEGIASAFLGEGSFTYMSEYVVDSLNNYLKTAYDPGSGFTLGEINVKEVKETTANDLNYDISLSSVSTWYGDITNTEPSKKYVYSLVNGEETSELDEAEYNDFSSDDLIFDKTEAETIEKIRISGNITSQYPSIKNDPKVVTEGFLEGGSDITDDILNNRPGEYNKSNFENCTESGLFGIAKVDKGTYNASLGAGSGSDYLYVKYEKDIDKYKEGTKTRKQVLDTTNVKQEVASTTETKLNTFLGLLKNDDGTIPTGGNVKNFKQDGKVVLYGDIYEGHIPAGDLLLDNGALMLFDLLEKSQSTQGLVIIFKYLSNQYLGRDVHDVDLEELEQAILMMGFIAGSGGDVVNLARQYLGYTGAQWSQVSGYQGEWCANFATYIYKQCGVIPACRNRRWK